MFSISLAILFRIVIEMYQGKTYNEVVASVKDENVWVKSAKEEEVMRKIIEKWKEVRLLNDE